VLAPGAPLLFPVSSCLSLLSFIRKSSSPWIETFGAKKLQAVLSLADPKRLAMWDVRGPILEPAPAEGRLVKPKKRNDWPINVPWANHCNGRGATCLLFPGLERPHAPDFAEGNQEIRDRKDETKRVPLLGLPTLPRCNRETPGHAGTIRALPQLAKHRSFLPAGSWRELREPART
jgi:hypothetical protein